MRRWPIGKKKSFDQNICVVIPMMYDYFIGHAATVIHHPRSVNELHQMRIEGKPLRYLMELSQEGFGEEFRVCLKQIKDMIEVMGRVHDYDVAIPMIRQHIEEIRFFNRRVVVRSERIALSGLRQLLREFRLQRARLFQEVVNQLYTWQHGDFRSKLLQSLTRETSTIIQPILPLIS